MEGSKNLAEIWKELGSNKPTLEEQFMDRADFLMNKVCVVAGNNQYRIVDCEVYYHSKQHPDPFIHSVVNKHEHQLNSGTWFFNDAGGLDLTFGTKSENEEEKVYAAFLIRGIQDKSGEYTSGIRNVVNKIILSFKNAFINESSIHLTANLYPSEAVFELTRVNLSEKINNIEYKEKPYRYIILSPEMKSKDSILTKLVHKGEISKEDATKILGYNKKIW